MLNNYHEGFKKVPLLKHRRIKTSNDLALDQFNSTLKKQKYFLNSRKFKQQHLKSILEKANLLYNQQGNLNEVIQLLQEYLIYRPDDNQALYLAAISYLNIGYSLGAIRKLELISNNYINKSNSLLLLAMAYGKLDNIQKSLQVINECILKYPRFQQAYSYRGKIYLKLQAYENAEQDFNYSIKLNPYSFISRVGLGDCYYQQKKYKSAISYYQQSLQYLNIKQSHKQSIKYLQSDNSINTKNTIHLQQNSYDIILKQSICYFQLQQYSKVIELLQTLPTNSRTSQSYYYQGISNLRLNRKGQGKLNLQYCIRLQTNLLMIQKAFKVLIQEYLREYQFYQALNLLKIIDNISMKVNQLKYWKNLIEGCMLIIKGYYRQGYVKLNEVYQFAKEISQNRQEGQTKQRNKSNINNFNGNKTKIQLTDQHYKNQFLQSPHNQKPKRSSFLTRQSSQPNKRKSLSFKHVKKSSTYIDRAKSIFKTIHDRSILNLSPKKSNDSKIKIKVKRFFSLNQNNQKEIKEIRKPQQQLNLVNQKNKQIFNDEEVLFIMPIVLKFKAYAQFFEDNFLKSLQTHQQYENYMKNVFGKQHTQILYNKLICEALLLNQTQLYKQSLQKFDQSILQYRNFYGTIPIQPLLYKIALLMQLFTKSLQQKDQQQTQTKYDYLEKVLDINKLYKQQLQNNYLAHYYLGIIYYLCEKYQQAQQQLQKTLKIVEECTWKILNLKGVVQIILQNYYDAIKQFTAGLIFQQNAELYLGRSIAFLLEGVRRREQQLLSNNHQSDKDTTLNLKKISKETNQLKNIKKSDQMSSQVFIENSFQDLQKYIELQSDQDKVSLWVTKILFFNEAYEEAIKALQKIDNKDDELNQIESWLRLYQGQFEQCGEIGYIIMDAFEGNLLTENQEKLILTTPNQAIRSSLQEFKINPDYQKWLIILHLSKKQKYPELIKYIQKLIFQTQNTEELIQLKYNLILAYLLQGDKTRALNVLQAIKKTNNCNFVNNQKIRIRLKKIVNFQFDQDQCLPDLSQVLGANQNHRLSQYLPYKPLLIKSQKVKRIYIKLSIPFPKFPKPNLTFHVDHSFLLKQLSLSLPQKRIQAPWIKRNKQKIQFTEQIIQAETDFLKETKQFTQKDQQDQFNNEQLKY